MKTKELPNSFRTPSFYPGIRYHVFTTKNRICAGQWRPLPRPCHGVRQQISSQNALRHTLLARCVVVEGESHEGFEETLNEHLDRFQPADGVEFGIVEEMVAAWWRMRRAWALETRLLSDCVDDQRPGDEMGRLAAAFNTMADSKALALLHRYETRLNRTYQRGLKNLLLLQTLKVPNER